ncbi:MAG: hypothetical protein MR298_01875 [Odoribacter sp.]|nr:hypothetical protein [Odoribacter sp.]
MALKKPKILYEKGTVQKMAKAMGVSEGTIRNALRFVTEGEQPDKIRKEAIELYGCALVSKPIN